MNVDTIKVAGAALDASRWLLQSARIRAGALQRAWQRLRRTGALRSHHTDGAVPSALVAAARDAAAVRQLAHQYRQSDPGFAQDLYAASMRHERIAEEQASVPAAAARLDVVFDQAPGHELHHLAQHVDVRSLLGKFGQCPSGGGRRGISFGSRWMGRTST